MASICILVQNHYDFDIRVRRKAEALVKAGYSVDVFALRGNRAEKTYSLNEVNVCTVSLGKKRGSLARYAFEYAAFFVWALVCVTAAMRRRRYAIVDVNTLPDFLVFAAVFARWMGAKVILDMHEITPEFCISKYRIGESSCWVKLMRLLERLSFTFADRVITINKPIEDLLVGRGLPRWKSTIVMNATDETNFLAQRPKHNGNQESPRRFIMMYHGTLTRLYGLDIAVEAFSMVHRDMPGTEFWVLGDGPDLALLQLLAAKSGVQSNFKLIGLVPPDEIPSWLGKCDVGILPIRRDVFLDFAFPNKLSEYIVAGRAVIISRLKTIRHYFGEDAVAYFEPNDPADLARQMLRLYNDQFLRAHLAVTAMQAYAPMRWELMRDRYLALIQLTLATCPGTLQVVERTTSVQS